MKRSMGLLALLAAAAMVLAFCITGCSVKVTSDSGSATSKSSTTATVTQGVGTDNTLTVGFDASFPPYGYMADDGTYTGFDLDLATEVAKRNGWDIKLQPIDWDSKDAELASGTIDCIWNGFTIEGREDNYTWTDAYMDNSQVVVVKADSGITKLADLAGKNVGVQAGSAALALLSDDGDQATLAGTFASLTSSPDYVTAFSELAAGSVDAVAIDLPVAKFEISSADDPSAYVILDEQLSTEHYGVGFLKGNTTLRDQVQKTLLEMVADGTVQTIAEKYADQGISYDNWILGKDATVTSAASTSAATSATSASATASATSAASASKSAASAASTSAASAASASASTSKAA